MEKETAVFGGGCFWCTEAVFKMLNGVISVEPGYSGGKTDSPTYEEVSTKETGHAECIKIEFNPAKPSSSNSVARSAEGGFRDKISYQNLLTVFFGSHDPTTKNRQGDDVGAQYRSVIFYTTLEQKQTAESFIKELNESSQSGRLIITEVLPLDKFYTAEDYHKDYYDKNKSAPYCEVVINPKLEKVQQKFAELL